jgi:Amt family ammonium transporter
MEQASADLLWIVIAAALVFLMQAGFLCLETGFTRSKNSINVAVKNLADFGLSMLLFWAVGFGVMFGATEAGLVGASRFVPDLTGGSGFDAAFFLFQVVFCGTAVTIVSGAVAERVRFGGYLFISLVVALTYPIFGHWAWGGALEDQSTWLFDLGFVDFAGSTVVHGVGGWFALIACVIIGPRLGRFNDDGTPHETPSSNLPVAMLGTLLLWFGWIGFNGGSTLAWNPSVPGIILNTMLAAAAGMAVSGALGWASSGHPRPAPLINGTLAGLVAITAGCHCVSTGGALLIGSIGALVAHGVYLLMLRRQIDDVISAAPVHLAAGAWGTIAVALLGDTEVLATGLGRFEQLQVQVLGVLACGGICLAVGLPTLYLAQRWVGLRVSVEEERLGLNVAEHGASTELYDFASTLEKQRATRDMSLRVPVEPFTEVGQIAEQYNAVMATLERSTTDVAELKATEQLLREATREAEAANRAKTEFLANISHEIRTPLHGILSFSRFGLKKSADPTQAKVNQYFQTINTSGERLLLLVNDLLDLAKLESGQMVFEFAEQDLGNVVSCVVDEFASLLSEQRIVIELQRPPRPMIGTADRGKLMQVVRNVISNAVKFSPIESTIRVELSETSDGKCELSVADQGPGIPDAELTSVFDKFVQSSQTKSAAGGTGLGLSICTQIMQGHGGRIWAEHAEGGGARFVMRWPRNAGQGQIPRAA